MSAVALPTLIQRFFTDRLCVQMEASRHTVAGYRDTFRLLLGYAGARYGKPPVKLTVEDIDAVVLPLRCDERSNLAAALPAHPRDAQQALGEAHGDVPGCR